MSSRYANQEVKNQDRIEHATAKIDGYMLLLNAYFTHPDPPELIGRMDHVARLGDDLAEELRDAVKRV